ncbi:uroporphyrinogen decarboxylase family protein [Anaerovibrio sp.]|uniref:uroporphyrinogen decarboxylase family protein n=1 Tax=Anaerovibrio sp. TaxID=1872532 RepID=UPI003F13DDA9
MSAYLCPGKKEKPISSALLGELGISVEEAYSEPHCMARVAEAVQKENGDIVCHLPFASTVEAQQWGVAVSISGLDNSLLPGESIASNPGELLERLAGWQLESGPVADVLSAIHILAGRGRKAVLNLQGPFSVLGLLLPPRELLKSFRKSPGLLEEACRIITGQLAEYAGRAAACGAAMISYSDSFLSPGMLSPAVYERICAPAVLQAVQAVAASSGGIPVHICTRSMWLLRDRPGTEIIQQEVADTTYGEAVLSAVPLEDGSRIVVNGCMLRSAAYIKSGKISLLKILK